MVVAGVAYKVVAFDASNTQQETKSKYPARVHGWRVLGKEEAMASGQNANPTVYEVSKVRGARGAAGCKRRLTGCCRAR